MSVIGRLVVSIVGDIKGLDGALKEASNRVANFNKNIDKISQGFTDAGKFATKYFTLPVLAGSAAVGGALLKVGSDFDSAYDTIRIGTGKIGEDLEGLKDDFRKVVADVPTDFASAGQAIADLSTRLKITGEPLRNLATRFLNLARITQTDINTLIPATTRIFGDWAVATSEQSGALDYLFKVSQNTGVTIEQLGRNMVYYGAPLRQMGFDFETAAVLMGKFEQEGVNTELVLGSLRIALTRMAQEGVKDPAEALQTLIQRIKDAGTAGEANTLALETFGARAGPDMAAAIREGRFDFEGLISAIKKSPETINTAAQATDDWREKLITLRNKIMLAAEPLAGKFFDSLGSVADKLTEKLIPAFKDLIPKLEPVIEKVIEFTPVLADLAIKGFGKIIEIVGKVIKWFSNLDPRWQKLIALALGVAAAVGPVLIVIGQLIPLLKMLTPLIWAVNAAMNANPIGAVIMALTALIAIGILVWKNWDTIRAKAIEIWGAVRDFFVSLWEKIKQAFQAAWEWIKNMFLNYTPYGLLIQHWEEIVGMFSDIWERIKTTFKNAMQAIWNWMLNWVPGLKLIVDNWGTIVGWFSDKWNKIKNIFMTIGSAIKNFVVKNFEAQKQAIMIIWNAVRNFFITVWEGIKNIFVPPIEFIKNLITTAFTWLKDNFIIPVWTSIKDFFSNLWDNMVERLNVFKDKFLKVWDFIKEGLKKPINAIIGIINRLIGGIESMVNSMARALNRIHFKIPEWLGKLIPGLAGREWGFNLPSVSLPRIPKLALGGIIDEAGFVDVGERGRERIFLPKGAKVVPLEKTQSITNYYNITSPKPLTESEIRRQLDLLSRQMGMRMGLT